MAEVDYQAIANKLRLIAGDAPREDMNPGQYLRKLALHSLLWAIEEVAKDKREWHD